MTRRHVLGSGIFLLVLGVVAVAVFSRGPGPFAAIPEESVPEAIRREVMDLMEGARDLVWRVYQQAQGYRWWALTSGWMETPPGSTSAEIGRLVPRYRLEVWRLTEEGHLEYAWSVDRGLTEVVNVLGLKFVRRRAFDGAGILTVRAEGAYHPVAGEPTVYGLRAGGIAFDRRVARVIGVTTAGEEVGTVPVRGFWFLDLDRTDVDERWATFMAYDVRGHRLHTIHAQPT